MYGKRSDWFGMDSGVRQGCVIAPLLFNVFVDYVAREAFHELPCGFKVGYRVDDNLVWIERRGGVEELLLQFFLYADDMVLLCDNPHDLCIMLNRLEQVTQKWGLHINVSKTKIMCVGKDCTWSIDPVSLRGEAVGLVDKFTYLGSVVNKSNTLDDEVAHRLSSAAAAFHRLDACLWKSRHVSLRTKLAVFKVVVLPCLLYASETWTPLRRHVQPLEVFLNRCLRRILGVTWRDRVRTEELRARCGNTPSIASLLCRARLRWLGHMGRLDFGRVCRRMLSAGRVVGHKRPRQGCRRRWCDLAASDLVGLNLGHSRWYEVCQDREVWREHVVEAVSG
jgi:hypothetical protein